MRVGATKKTRALTALLSRALGLWIFALAAGAQARAPLSSPRTLRSVRQVERLSNNLARRAFPVTLEGVVTYSDPEWGLLFLRDPTGSIYIDVHGWSARYRPGTRLRITGVTAAGDVGPVVEPRQVAIIGHGAAPKPEQLSIAELNAGDADSRLVATEGVLHPCDGTWYRVCFRIFDGIHAAWVVIPLRDNPRADRLIGATVRVKGVCGSHLNAAHKRVAAQLFVSSLDDIAVVAPAPVNLFASAPLPAASLRDSDAAGRFVQEVHLRGVVAWESPPDFILQDDSGTALIQTVKNTTVNFGRMVDVTGFPSHGRYGLQVSDAAVRPSSLAPDAAWLKPVDTSAAEIIGRAMNVRRVHLRARLVSQSTNGAGDFLQLEDGGTRFLAFLPRRDPDHEFVKLTPDSRLELTGLAIVHASAPARPPSLLVLVESPADIVVEGGFGWLTTRRALLILVALALCVIVPFIWAALLRRTVRRQTAIIRARLEHELHLETQYRRLFERNLAAVFTWRPDGIITDANMAFVRLLGLESREELIGRSYWDFETKPGNEGYLPSSPESEALSNRDSELRRKDNVIVHLIENITPVATPEGLVYETTAIDVTLLRQNQAELQRAKNAAEYEALYDPLTGLPNRRFLLDAIQTVMAGAREQNKKFALLFLDLDGFKLINDSLGHPVGDALLVQLASCLRSWIRKGDTLARLGGDEFMLILKDLNDTADAALVAENLLGAISAPFQVKGHELAIGASIGISIFPDNATDAEELMQQADSAMYAAKREGKNRVMNYTPKIGSEVNARSTLENLLRGAIGRGEISVHYQPEFDLRTGRLIRFEALARWSHPNIGSISPAEFIPIAEESGLIGSLGAYIMEQACQEAARWQGKWPHPLQIAVNLSTWQLRRSGYVEEVTAILARSGLRPELLQIELTESAMLGQERNEAATLDALRRLGISLAIDDFGTGYSNLSYLPSLPLDALKISEPFIRDIGTHVESDSMIRALIALAHNMGLRVIVEGVERPEQLELIKAMDADEVQGFLLGRPTPNPEAVIGAAMKCGTPTETASLCEIPAAKLP